MSAKLITTRGMTAAASGSSTPATRLSGARIRPSTARPPNRRSTEASSPGTGPDGVVGVTQDGRLGGSMMGGGGGGGAGGGASAMGPPHPGHDFTQDHAREPHLEHTFSATTPSG